MLIPVPSMLNSVTFKHQRILIINSKDALIMALGQMLEAWEAQAAPNIIGQEVLFASLGALT